MKLIKHFLLSLLLCTSINQAAEPLTVHLKPPRLTATITTSCNRPKRSEGVNISSEYKDDKLIVHCYGHGGFGFTTLFGSIQEALDLLIKENPSLQTPIRIIGSGCMGLTMAAELHRRGYSNITISTKEKYNIPSWRAGGFFDPGVGTEETPQEKHHLKLGLETYSTLSAIEQGIHPYLTSAIVQRMPMYYPADYNVGVEALELHNLMPHSELVTLDFGNGVSHEGYKKQYTYFINVTELMNQLWAYIEHHNIQVINEEIHHFDQCPEPIICNCTGLGSKFLNQDAALYPVRGHFFMLEAQEGQIPDYMLFTKVLQNNQKEMIYFFPKPAFRLPTGESIPCSGILGGTFIPCSDSDANIDDAAANRHHLDEIEFTKLAERTQHFFYGATN